MKILHRFLLFICILAPLGSTATLAQTSTPEAARIAPELVDVVASYGDHEAKNNAEILYKYRQITLNDAGKDEAVTYLAIRINHEDAIPYYSQFELPFDEYYETLQLDFARVKTLSGDVLNLPQSAVQIKTANDALFYNEQKVLTFSAPKLMPGAIIEFQYRRKTLNSAIKNHWFHTEVFSWQQRNSSTGEYSFDAVGESEVVINAPINRKIYLHGQSTDEIKQSQYQETGRQIIKLSRHNIEKMVPQEMMPSHWFSAPTMVLTTLENWQQLNQFSYQTFKSGVADSDHTEIANLAEKITAQAENPQQKLQAIFSYVQHNIRYVYAHLGRGGLTPHTPNWTLKNGFGDCKDQSALLISLLKAVGVQAYPALYHSSGVYILKSAPRLMFDHMIVYLPQQKGINSGFIDTSNYKLQFPGISPHNNSAQALVLGQNQSEEAFINLGDGSTANTLDMVTDYYSITEEKISAKITLSAKGYFDDYFRSIWLQSQERDKTLKGIIKTLFNGGTITSLTLENDKDLFKPVVVTANIEFDMNSKIADGLLFGASYKQVANTFMPVGAFTEKQERHHGLYNAMELDITHTTRISADMGLYANLVQQPVNVDTPLLKMTSKALMNEDMALQMNIAIEPFTLPVSEIKSFTTPFNDAMENGNWLIQVKPGKLNSTTQLASDNQTMDLAGIKNLIDRGAYEQALTSVKVLLEKQEDGEGYFFKGLVLGFLNQHDESDAAFEKAESLGYEI